MTMDSAHAPHPGREGTGTKVRRPVAAIHPPRAPLALARPAFGAQRARRRDGALPLLAGDAAAVLCTVAFLPGLDWPREAAAPLAALLIALHAQGGLYRPRLSPSALLDLPALLCRTLLAWCAAAAAVAAVSPRQIASFGVLAAAIALQSTLVCLSRGCIHQMRRRSVARQPRSTLVVGRGGAARQITAALYGRPSYGMRPVGIIDPSATAETTEEEGRQNNLPVLVTHEDVRRAVIQNSVTSVVFTRPPASDERTAVLVRLLHRHGCRLWLADADGTTRTAGLRAESADQLWGFAVRPLLPRPTRPLERIAKRAIDASLAGLALLAAAPVLAVCALVVRFADGPGVIFRQERVGLDGRPFTLLKFRTLRPADEHESATRWNISNDHRMGRVGSFLRKSSLDELPQLWNVLRGDMSLVGPRPERPFFVAKFSATHPGYEARHRMPVGITGLAQINGLRGDTSIEDRARFDNHYIDTWSLWQDLWILARTAASAFRFRLGGS
ncbi:exopolysaccharide biosynthesis polyprenyl glycosylphosphotransferase [Streptomyces sp. NPDC006879]|uniref:exopolysaccharide biosynthesis polyprenyl glycosylphosphotransferase n=1 Tax=Streptomyces sp. NPDC006879 TaxID=3364767 RepID=UPI0036C0BAD9